MQNLKVFTGLLMVVLLSVPAVSAETIYVHQGDTIYWNDTVDLSGVLSWDEDGTSCVFAWWRPNQEPSGHNAPNITKDVCEGNARRVNVTSTTFPRGAWFKWTGKWDDAENNLAFYVDDIRPVLNDTYEIYNITAKVKTLANTSAPILPARHVADILVAQGDPVVFGQNITPAKAWIFGRVDSIYDWDIEGRFRIPENLTSSLEPGTYDVLYQYPGKDGEYDVVFNRPEQKIAAVDMEYLKKRTGYAIRTFDTADLQPKIMENKLRDFIVRYGDEYNMSLMEVQSPSVEINEVEEKEFKGANLVEIRGYTNVIPGTKIKIILDEDKQNVRTILNATWTAIAEGENPGDMRTFRALLPLYYDELSPGQHHFTAELPNSAKTTVSFHVYEIPEGQEKPKSFVRYIGGNEWITPEPSPTPVTIVEYRTIIVTQTPEPTPTIKPTVIKVSQGKATTPMTQSAPYLFMVIPSVVLAPPLTPLLIVLAVPA